MGFSSDRLPIYDADFLNRYAEVERVQKYCTQVKVPLHY